MDFGRRKLMERPGISRPLQITHIIAYLHNRCRYESNMIYKNWMIRCNSERSMPCNYFHRLPLFPLTLHNRSNKIRFQYPGSQFTVEKINNQWAGTRPYKFTVSQDKISAVLSVLQNLIATKIPAQTFAGTGLEKHSVIVQVTGNRFDDTIMIGDCTKDNLCYAKTAASDNIYLITKTDRDALNKKITDLQ